MSADRTTRFRLVTQRPGVRLRTAQGEIPVSPTVLEIADTLAPVWCREVFGPALAAKRFAGFDEAIKLANESPYGLSASVFTNDYSLVERAAELDAGMVHINSASIGADPHVPFGGTGDSGFGPREQGTAARDFYTQSKTIYQKWVPAHA